jgi:hypothetical protein
MTYSTQWCKAGDGSTVTFLLFALAASGHAEKARLLAKNAKGVMNHSSDLVVCDGSWDETDSGRVDTAIGRLADREAVRHEREVGDVLLRARVAWAEAEVEAAKEAVERRARQNW